MRRNRMIRGALALGLGLTIGAAAARSAGQSGGIVPTENHPVEITSGPEADLTFFATGEAIGKLEPCG